MFGCRAVLCGMLAVVFGGGPVAAGFEALIVHIGHVALGPVDNLDEVGPVSDCCVVVLSAHRSVGGGIDSVASVLRVGGAAGLSRGVTLLGPAVTLLG